MFSAFTTARYRQQRGIGLVSVMIALVIWLFLLAGLFDRWYSMNRTFNAQNELAQLQASERAAFIAIENTVQAAGYFLNYFNFTSSRPSSVPAPKTPITADSAFPAAGVFVTGQYISGTHGAGGDTLTVRFMAGEHSLDCQGQRSSPGAIPFR